jgi:uncharacterized protein YndB with AHSA1/START domain
MKHDKLIAEASVLINAPVDRVWRALTTPEMIRKYLMGTEVTCEWKPGSPITFEGEYQGRKYKDKGEIKKIEPPRTLQMTYWSSMGGKVDKPENYNLVTYDLAPVEGMAKLTVTQDNVATENEKEHAAGNWKMVLAKLRTVMEQE